MHTRMISESDLRELEKEKGRTHTEKATAGGRVPHPDCDACKHLRNGSCQTYNKCSDWLAWFRYEWNGIRKAAEKLKKRRKSNEN